MDEQFKTLYEDMRDKLRQFDGMAITPVKRLSEKLNVIQKATDTLKQYVASDALKDSKDEIEYFKYVKPLFVSEQFFAQHYYNIETKRKELKEPLQIKSYLEQELEFARHFLSQRQFLYQYFRLEATELDGLLFRRGAEASPVILPEIPDLDPIYSTKGEYLFAKFITYERLTEYLTAELYPATEREVLKRFLTWTGDKMNLIEIAYAIYDTAQINNGEIDIKDIIEWLEESLNITLNRYYRMFNEMKDRKMVSPTRYLDHATAMVKEHLRSGDAFRPQAPRPVSGSKSKNNK